MKKILVVLSIVIFLEAAIGVLLLQRYSGIQNEYTKLLGNYTELKQENSRLQAEYTKLSEEHSKLQAEYTKLLGNYTELKQENSRLQAEYTKLSEEHSKLQANYAELQENYSKLQEEYLDLQKQKEPEVYKCGEFFLKIIKNPVYLEIHVQVSGTLKEVSRDGTKIVLEKEGKEVEISISQNPWIYDLKENKPITLSELKPGDRITASAVVRKEIPEGFEQLEFIHIYRG